jgi:hypothetical protein
MSCLKPRIMLRLGAGLVMTERSRAVALHSLKACCYTLHAMQLQVYQISFQNITMSINRCERMPPFGIQHPILITGWGNLSPHRIQTFHLQASTPHYQLLRKKSSSLDLSYSR